MNPKDEVLKDPTVPTILKKLEEYANLRKKLEVLKEEASGVQVQIDDLIHDIHQWVNTFPEDRRPKNLPLGDLGTFLFSSKRYWRIIEPEKFEEWRREKAIPFETFYAANAKKLSSYCKDAEELNAELPKGITSFDKERISWRRNG